MDASSQIIISSVGKYRKAVAQPLAAALTAVMASVLAKY